MSEGLAFYYHEMSDADVGISRWRWESTFYASKENLEVSEYDIFPSPRWPIIFKMNKKKTSFFFDVMRDVNTRL